MTACGDERPDARWIVPPYLKAFVGLHAAGWAHSVEVWEKPATTLARTLVGGIYGVAIGGLFAGESMFHRRTDASKIAFAALVASPRASGFELFDVQVMNPHLESLGCIEITRDEYLDRVEHAVARQPIRLVLDPYSAASARPANLAVRAVDLDTLHDVGSNRTVTLQWSGKERLAAVPLPLAKAASLAPTTLADGAGELIQGDNLVALRSLARTHHEKVTLAYLDPPFFTGRVFTHVERVTGVKTAAFDDRWVDRAAYLEALAPRIEQMRALLAPHGSIVIHVDPKTSHYLKVLADEIFGEDAFASEIVWRYRRWPSKTPNFQRVHDVLLRYRKDVTCEPRWNQPYEPLAASTLATWGTKKQRAVFATSDGPRGRRAAGAIVVDERGHARRADGGRLGDRGHRASGSRTNGVPVAEAGGAPHATLVGAHLTWGPRARPVRRQRDHAGRGRATRAALRGDRCQRRSDRHDSRANVGRPQARLVADGAH